jgi:hypothetical protein
MHVTGTPQNFTTALARRFGGLSDADATGESMAIASARHGEFLCRSWLPEHQPTTDIGSASEPEYSA